MAKKTESKFDSWWDEHVIVIGPDDETATKLNDAMKSSTKPALINQAEAED